MKIYWAKIITALISEESGQAISEYASIIAIAALLVALVFGSSSCHRQAVSQSFSTMVRKLNGMAGLSKKHSSQIIPKLPQRIA